LLGLQADRAREASVVRGDPALAEQFGQLVGDAFDETPRVDEHERRAVLGGELRDAGEDLAAELLRGDGAERLLGHPHRQVPVPYVPDVDDRAIRRSVGPVAPGPDEQAGDLLDRFLGRRQSDALQPSSGGAVEALEGQGQMRAALVLRDGVDLVDDHRFRGAEEPAAVVGGQQDVEGLGRGDQDVGRALDHRGAFRGRGVAGSDCNADLGQLEALGGGELANLAERFLEVLLDVVAERLEGRDVDHRGLVGQVAVGRALDQLVDRPQEG
jgi:hypothetical protein